MAEQVIAEYKDSALERAEIDEWEWENDFDFTILGLMEVYSSYVGGYASQIATEGKVLEPRNAIKLLEKKRLFDESYFVDWSFSGGQKYVKVKKYANNLDYLRMLVIDYIQRLYDINNIKSAIESIVSEKSASQSDVVQVEMAELAKVGD